MDVDGKLLAQKQDEILGRLQLLEARAQLLNIEAYIASQTVASLGTSATKLVNAPTGLQNKAEDRKNGRKSTKSKKSKGKSKGNCQQPKSKKNTNTAQIYYKAPEPCPIPAHFKGIRVKIEEDLMGIDNDIQKRLRELCSTIPIPSARFKRAPSDYYTWTLEKRRDLLGAPHVDYLCKTMIMRNTKSKATDCSDRTDSKYYMIVVQYTNKMNKERLMRIVRNLRPEEKRLTKKQISLRVASSEEGVTLSGYGHNAVTPVGMAVSVPMIVSHRILELPYIWLGGGEKDVKLAISVPDLCRVFNPIIGDIG
ncbi:hypothetical protein AAMO2058_001451900 [Amorphochlora amoebiformis]